eukprot:CFRG7904T1
METTFKVALITKYLLKHGYTDAAHLLESETGIQFNSNDDNEDAAVKVSVNDDLDVILDHWLEKKAGQDRLIGADVLPVLAEGVECVAELLGVVKNIHSGNIVDARVVNVPHVPTETSSDEGADMVLCTAGVDKTARLFTINKLQKNDISYELMDSLDYHKGCVLEVHIHPTPSTHPFVLTCSMDKSAVLYNLRTHEPVQTFLSHKKFVTRASFSPVDGRYIALGGSYDQTVSVHVFDEDTHTYLHIKTFDFMGAVESLCFNNTGTELCVGVRNDCDLHFTDFIPPVSEDGKPFTSTSLNMNRLKDDWVSFTPMYISYSASDKFLLVSTDKSRMNLYIRDGLSLITSFYGSMNDEYSQPRHCWDPNECFIYQTSQDNCIYGWSVITQQLVTKLPGHTKQVRNLSGYTASDGNFILISCAYDGTVRLWQ